MNEQENKQQQPFKGFPITFNVYARNEQEVEDLRMAIIAFIGFHARQGRAIDAARLAQAIGNWDKNPIVKSQIIKHFT
jgi:hypothetical protein